MATQSAVVTLTSAGAVEKAHKPDNAAPTTGTSALGLLLGGGFLVQEIVALEGGRVVIHLKKT